MAQLAIKGHVTRGNEVIEILEMLGGKNKGKLKGTDTNLAYYIHSEGYIATLYSASSKHYKTFTIEEFFEKYPYKVGDKVINTTTGDIVKIVGLVWQENTILYNYHVTDINYYGVTTVNKLLPYKEAPMYLNGKANKQSEEIMKTIEAVKEIMEETDTMGHTSELKLNHPVFNGSNEIEIIIPDGWEFKQRGNKMFGVRKQPQYPKTYEECCKVLGIDHENYLSIRNLLDDDGEEETTKYEQDVLDEFAYLWELKICRDTYWKIAGEQMGLDKPWEPDWVNAIYTCTIICRSNKIVKDAGFDAENQILAFPTEEMRDAFYENFKDLIEECKEFL